MSETNVVNEEAAKQEIQVLGKEIYESDKLNTVVSDDSKLLILGNEDLVLMFDMLKAYVRKEYNKCPLATVWMITFAIAYWVFPNDVVNDHKFSKVVGKIDDSVVVTLTMCAVKSDIQEFDEWRREQKLAKVNGSLDGALAKLVETGS